MAQSWQGCSRRQGPGSYHGVATDPPDLKTKYSTSGVVRLLLCRYGGLSLQFDVLLAKCAPKERAFGLLENMSSRRERRRTMILSRTKEPPGRLGSVSSVSACNVYAILVTAVQPTAGMWPWPTVDSLERGGQGAQRLEEGTLPC